MKLSTAAKKLFSDGVVGSRVDKDLGLPAEYFPAGSSYNVFPDLSEKEQQALRHYSFGHATTSGAKGTPLEPMTKEVKKATFLNLNASAVRYSPAHRLWRSDEIYASHQRRDFGCSLLVIRIPISETELSEPFFQIVGPMATPFQGYALNTAKMLDLPEGETLPIIHGTTSLPEHVHPTMFSLASTSRDWIVKADPPNPLEAVRLNGELFTVLTSETLHRTVLSYDSGCFISSGLITQPEVIAWNLAIAEKDESSPGVPWAEKALQWANKDPLPPNPRTSHAWNPSIDDTGAKRTDASDTDEFTYQAAVPKDTAMLHTGAASSTAHIMLLPSFIRFPLGAALPVGLRLKVGETTGERFRQAVAFLAGDTTTTNTRWLDSILLDTWIAAVNANPNLFAVTAYPHKFFTRVIPLTASPDALSLRLHLEWSVASQFFWDKNFVDAPSGRIGLTSYKLGRYATALIEANNDCDAEDAKSNDWGYFSSVFRHPFLPKLRPIGRDSGYAMPEPLAQLLEPANEALPIYMHNLYAVDAVFLSRNRVYCPGITESEPIIDASRTSVSVEDDWDDDADGEQSNNDGEEEGPSDQAPNQHVFFNPFSAIPPAVAPMGPPPKKKQRRVALPSGLHLGTTLAAPAAGASHTLASSAPLVHFDPFPVISATSKGGGATSDSLWLPPFLLKNHPPFPPAPHGAHSHALVTALHQSMAMQRAGNIIQTATQELSATYEVSRDLMLSNCVTKEAVWKLAHWLSYRCRTASDPNLMTIRLPVSSLPDEYSVAPGRVPMELSSKLKAAFQKNANSPAVNDLTNWFKEQVADGSASHDSDALECHIHQNFFTYSVIQGIQNVAIRSGSHILTPDEPTGIITPWTFLRSLTAFQGNPTSRLPANGLSPSQIRQIILNIVFFFHTLSCDYRDSKFVGTSQSAFSRFSPLAGHLLHLAALFDERNFANHWESRLSVPSRVAYTKAAFCAIAALFRFYEDWMRPKFDAEEVFLEHMCDGSTLVTISPATNVLRERLLKDLVPWREQVKVFTERQIQNEMPRDGFFAAVTPPCYLPRTSTQDSNEERTNPSQNRGVRQGPRDQQRDGQRAGRSRDPQGESRQPGLKAVVPMITCTNPGFIKNMGALLSEINHNNRGNRIRSPYCRPRNQEGAPICFRFTTAEGNGCWSPAGATCRFIHLDLNNKQWLRDNILRDDLVDLFKFLQIPGVMRHYKHTQAFKDFLDETQVR